MTAPETPLWAFLDRLGLPFRDPMGTLFARHGTAAEVWTDSHRLCLLPGKPLLPGAAPFGFPWREGCDPTLPPDWLCAQFRGPRRATDRLFDRQAERNLTAVLRALAPLGLGRDNATSNTLSRAWDFGMGRVEATVFPPRLSHHFGPNERHRLDPGSVTECSIAIQPGWLPDLTPAQIAWLRDFILLGQAEPPFQGRYGRPDRWHRWPATLGTPPQPGFGPSRDGAGFAVVSGDLVLALRRENILGLSRDELTPAKGSGGVSLTLTHAPKGHDLRYPHRLTLVQASYAPQALTREAKALATALALPLRETSYSDC